MILNRVRENVRFNDSRGIERSNLAISPLTEPLTESHQIFSFPYSLSLSLAFA